MTTASAGTASNSGPGAHSLAQPHPGAEPRSLACGCAGPVSRSRLARSK